MMHKLINGKKIDLTPDEEKEIQDEWERNKAKQDLKKIEFDQVLKNEEAKRIMKEATLLKIKSSLGLSDEEINSLF